MIGGTRTDFEAEVIAIRLKAPLRRERIQHGDRGPQCPHLDHWESAPEGLGWMKNVAGKIHRVIQFG